ncbi:MAG: hypothetical protein NC213_08190 [Acetobacter sp.]|nr:hypothetical protein [Bacteroides sp.]MCM1341709.1 hypothetical protein [Acetobacter sp.]MCM1432352.1 hypothetical protein [Clostridiales bacterium]
MKKTLNEKWLFKQTDSSVWKSAVVPGCNFLDLMNNDDIPDPFVSLNETEVQWVGEKDFEYKRIFEIAEEDLSFSDILLNCKMLDTICDVFVNGELLFNGNNCFVAYSYSVKNFIKTGENEIRIVFYSPVNYVKEKYAACPTPVNSNGQNGIVHIRKPQCHFGWDWGPVLACSGITKDIELEFVGGGKINYLKVEQKLNDNTAIIKASADITDYDNCNCKIILTAPNGDVLTENGNSAEFIIENPELWWTKELSCKEKQPLYTVKAVLYNNGKAVDETEKKIGVRNIELDRKRDKWGKNFQFKLNGVPLFIKGANYIPPDSFITRFDNDKLNYLLDAVQFSNMNMIRIWGGGYYESDEFFNACDERGILVWQDFQFACQAYPFFDSDFLNNVKKEIEYNVKRLCHHPSLAVWNGNNEIEDMHMSWVHMTKYVEWTEKFFYDILKTEIRKYDNDTPYTQGSPIGISHNNGVSSDNVGDTHLWGVWHGLKPMTYYRKRMTRFCSEFGFESLPDMKAIEQFAKPSDYDLNSDVFSAHQKCASGNDKMVYYIASRFNLPKKFKDYVYLSQVTQNECIADATEHWRRNKGRCNGSMYWQFNDCWGVCSWSSIDYYGNYKALQYGARHFNAPLSVSVEDTKDSVKIFVINDFNSEQKVAAEYEVFDFENGTIEKYKTALDIGSLENKLVFDLDVKKLTKAYNYKKTGICARLYQNGREIQQKVILFDKEKNLDLPKAKLKTKIIIEENQLRISIKTDNFARLVKVESSKSMLPFSDNFFDILPNEEKEIIIPADSSMTLRELAESINVYSLCNISFDSNKLKSKWSRIKVYLSPINIGNAVYHGKPAKDVTF